MLRVTTACDIFALGVLLVAVALGREPQMRLGSPPTPHLCLSIHHIFVAPHPTDNYATGFMKLAGGGIEPYVTQLLTGVEPPMSSEYIALTLAALRHDPAQRPGAADLARWLRNERPVPSPIPPAPAVAPPPRRPWAGTRPPGPQWSAG